MTDDIPVIVYTAAVLEAEEVTQLVSSNRNTINAYMLQKPFELDVLLTTVEQLLDKAVR